MTEKKQQHINGFAVRSDIKSGTSWISRYFDCRKEGGNVILSDLKCTIRASRETFFPKP